MFQTLDIVIIIFSFLMTFSLTFLYIGWALKHSIIDIPNKRSSHVKPTPRGGGIAIVFSFYTCLYVFYLFGKIDKELFFALLPGLIIALVGAFDDFFGLSPLFRSVAQIFCSILALFFLDGFHGPLYQSMEGIWFLIALFGFVWFINLFNFLDGSDGYASMEAISITLAVWYFTKMNVLLVLSFSIAGFYYWNWPKAKIFMGDSGSTTLGFILVVFGVYFHNINKLNFSFWIILTALFWFDATYTLLRRVYNKEALSLAHKKHIYQRAIQGGFSHLRTMISGLGINILLFIICISIINNIITYYLGIIILVLILSFILYYIGRKFAYEK